MTDAPDDAADALVPDMFFRFGTSIGYVIYTNGMTDMWDFNHNCAIAVTEYRNKYTPEHIAESYGQTWHPRSLRVSEGL